MLFLNGSEFEGAIVVVVWIGIDHLLDGMTQTIREMVVVSLFAPKMDVTHVAFLIVFRSLRHEA